MILFLIQGCQKIISTRNQNIRTKWLIKNYLIKLNEYLNNYNETANLIKTNTSEHSKSSGETKSVSYYGSENIHSTILKSTRYRDYFENRTSKETIIDYYDLCSLIDLLALRKPTNYSTEYANLSMYKVDEVNSFQIGVKRILVKLEACEANSIEAIKICERLIIGVK